MKRGALPLLVLLAACAPQGGPGENDFTATGRAGSAAPAQRNETAPSRRAPADMPLENRTDRVMPPTPEEGAGACRASRYRHLVGQHRSRIPSRPAGETWRVTCTSCPMTMDYSERRLNILYDERTQIIEEVRCG